MKQATFITGNQHKAAYLNQLLGVNLPHKKIDLDEPQSTDLHSIVTHKVHQAYQILGTPVLVEDVSLEFTALGNLPGTFIKFFVDADNGLEKLCRMLDGFSSRQAVARCTFGYFDGNTVIFFDGSLSGTIATHPMGEGGYGWDKIFCPNGYNGKTRAQLTSQQDATTYQQIKPFGQLRTFFTSAV